MIRDKKTGKIYYGYLSTFLAGLTIFGSNGILAAAAANYIAELTVNKGWDAAIVGNAFSIRTLFCLVMPIVGLVVAKFGPRRTIFWTTLVTGICLIITGYCTNPIQFMIVFGVAVGLSLNFNDTLATQTVAANWWVQKRAQASGVINGMAALGGFVFPMIIVRMLASKGWTYTMWFAGIALILITAVPQMILMKDHPEEVGQEMEGGHAFEVKKSKYEPRLKPTQVDWDAKDALKTPQVWLIAICWGFCCIAYNAIMYFSVTHFVMHGMDAVKATLFISVINIVAMVLAFLLSGIVNLIGPRIGYMLMCVSGGVACILVGTKVSENYATWIIPIILFTISSSFLNPMATNTIAGFYGAKNYPKIQSWLFPIFTILAALTSSVLGKVLQTTGDLSMAYVIAGIVTALGAVFAIFLKAPKVPQKYVSEGENR